MYEITSFDTCQISGGVSCMDAKSWSKLQNQAISHGIVLGILVTGIAAAGTLGLNQSITRTFEVGMIVFPYATAFGYFKSPVWNILHSE